MPDNTQQTFYQRRISRLRELLTDGICPTIDQLQIHDTITLRMDGEEESYRDPFLFSGCNRRRPYVLCETVETEITLPEGPALVAKPKGFVTDGASGPGIRDLKKEAWETHDWLYAHPVVQMKETGAERALSRDETDRAYGEILRRHGHWFLAWLRPLALSAFAGGPWRRHRFRDSAHGDTPGAGVNDLIVPCPDCWEFPIDPKYIGLDGFNNLARLRDVRWIAPIDPTMLDRAN